MFWWKRFKPNKSTLATALLATAICSVGLLLIWAQPTQSDPEMARFGGALSQTLAHANAGYLMHQERIELAVIANLVTRYPEVDGVVFYSAGNDIIAMSGSQDLGQHYTASATMDDTITGYVSVVLNPGAFAAPLNIWSWLASALILLSSPFVSLAIMQFSARGNRSLPIVSVPEPGPSSPQPAYCLTFNLHNQFALNKQAQQQAIDDALTMTQEVCAIHQGINAGIAERGVILLLDAATTPAANAICAAFLAQTLLSQFETDGEFRCCLSTTSTPGSAAEVAGVRAEDIHEAAETDQLLMLAALAKPHSVVVTQSAYQHLNEQEQQWASTFNHPLLDDIVQQETIYQIEGLPDQQQQLIDSQAMLILGFNQSGAQA